MAVDRRPRAESQAETRQRLLDAAARLFEEGGLHGTSVAQISRAAGYSTGAIYSNFPRKEDLALAVVERSEQADWDHLDRSLGNTRDLGNRLVTIVRWYRQLLATAKPTGVLRVELVLHAIHDVELREALIAGQRQQAEYVAGLIDRLAADAGSSLSVDPNMLAAALLGSADGTSVAYALDPSPQHSTAFAWTLGTLVMAAFDPQPIDPAGQADLLNRLTAAAR